MHGAIPVVLFQPSDQSSRVARLKYVVENNNRLVTKAELIGAVWPDSFVTEDSLVQCLVELRRALGDDGQQLIKTVRRRGYMFAANVEEINPAVDGMIYAEQVEGVRVVIEQEDRERTRSDDVTSISPAIWIWGWRARTVLVCALLLAGVAIGLFYIRASDKSKQAAPVRQVRSIAILPFKPLSADGSDDYLGLGMAVGRQLCPRSLEAQRASRRAPAAALPSCGSLKSRSPVSSLEWVAPQMETEVPALA